MAPTQVEELYRSAVDGDRDAVRQCVEHWSPTLLRIAVAMGLPHGTAEDAVHGAWMKFFRHLETVRSDPDAELRQPEMLGAWLKQVTRNTVNDIHRTNRRRRELAHRVQMDAEALGSLVYHPDDGERLERERQRSAMWAAIEQLDEDCRLILVMRLEDPPATYQEISLVLDRPEGAIGPTLGRCIDKLRRAMGVTRSHE